MAYVLGFFAADGNLTEGKRGNYYIEFTSCDKIILEKIKLLLDSTHKITGRKRKREWRVAYRLQIGNKNMFSDLTKLGITTKKSKALKLPSVPPKYFRDFLRGYFDGDGSVTFGYFKRSDRKSKSPILLTRFSSGSEEFLSALQRKLKGTIASTGSLKYYSGAWRLSYSTNDSKKLFKLMYGLDSDDLIFLKRKYNIYLKAGLRV
jgi:intein-encoded DNA endonuclease-like protein